MTESGTMNSEAGRRVNVTRPLTTHSTTARRGLAMHATQCDHCEQALPAGRPPHTRFCTTKCRIAFHAAAKRAQRRGPDFEGFRCRHCGRVIERKAQTGRFPQFCSRRCELDRARAARQSTLTPRVCPECGCEFVRPGNRAKFCSNKCKRRVESRRLGHIPIASIEERFWARVDIHAPRGCWQWTGGAMASGYGVIGLNRQTFVVHRYAWETLVAPISDQLQVDHICRNRLCANPHHLEPVTQQENLRRERVAKAIGHDVVAAMTVAEFAAIIGATLGPVVVSPLEAVLL